MLSKTMKTKNLNEFTVTMVIFIASHRFVQIQMSNAMRKKSEVILDSFKLVMLMTPMDLHRINQSHLIFSNKF